MIKLCADPECGLTTEIKCRGLCNRCYIKNRARGTLKDYALLYELPIPGAICDWETCRRPRVGFQRWCSAHYQRMLHGKPMEPPVGRSRSTILNDLYKDAQSATVELREYRELKRDTRLKIDEIRMIIETYIGEKACLTLILRSPAI